MLFPHPSLAVAFTEEHMQHTLTRLAAPQLDSTAVFAQYVVYSACVSCVFEMPRSHNTFAKMHPTPCTALSTVSHNVFDLAFSSLMTKP